MCGIAGAIWTDPSRAVGHETLRRMTEALRHRGPDAEGSYWADLKCLDGEGTYAAELKCLDGVRAHSAELKRCEGGGCLPGVALGHRRLAIIDVAGGRQPMANEDESIWVVLNGEIYNFRPLRAWLEGRGHRFRTHSDTEVLVHLYEEEGPEMLGRLLGMFALALWDARQGRLLLARDRLGKKPLVYREEAGRLLFASELKALLAVPGVPRTLDPRALDEYLTYQYVPHPRTIYRGMAKLPPGHYALWRDGRLEVHAYWQPDFAAEEDRPAREYADELRTRLTSAVELRLQSEVPLGAFLSGGIDSTIVVGLMRRLTDGPIRTFSIGFHEPEYDETRYARLVAKRFSTIHEEFRVEPRAIEILPRLAWHYDEPLADSSVVPTWYVSELTRRQVTVALTGDGGDELFAGYSRYQAVALAHGFDRLPAAVRRLLPDLLGRWLPPGWRQKSLLRRWRRFVDGLREPPERRYVEWMSIFTAAQRARLYNDDFQAELAQSEPPEFLAAALARAAGRDAVTAASLADLVTYLPCDLMAKVDTASMAHALECRQPFLDHRVVELAMRMPSRLKFRHGRGKRILLRAFGDLIPGPIRRRGKMGFAVPLEHWFRGPLRPMAHELLLAADSLGRNYFRGDAVRQLLDEHQAGRANHGQRLWALLLLEVWAKEWLGR
jgi:asparagine synthase (glutamine-hydrolysing)